MLQALVNVFDGEEDDQLWQFRDVRFDLEQSFNYTPWQKVSSVVQNVQDVKGNPGETGVLVVSNLRLIWYMQHNTGSNISVGYDAMTKVQKKVIFLPNNTTKYLLHIKATRVSSRYQFQFSSLAEDVQKTYEMILKFYRMAFETANYRKIQLKSSLITRNGELISMNNQEVKSTYPNVKYFIEKSQILGTLVVSNIRVAWLGKDPSSNFSVPWVCVCSIKIKDNFDMDTLTIEAKDRFGTLEFVLYSNQQSSILHQAERLFQTYRLKPYLGYDVSMLNLSTESKLTDFNQDIEIVQPTINVMRRPQASNYRVGADSSSGGFESIGFSEQLGLAIQAVPEGMTVADLWEILRP